MSIADSDAVRHLSKVMFGQEMRIAAMVAIGESDGLFTLSTLADLLQLRTLSLLQKPLKSLEDAGLIERMPNVGTRSVYYQRREDTSAWKFASELAEQAMRGVQVPPGLGLS